MHFNIYLDDDTAGRLQQEAQKSPLSRNAIIRQAIREWLENRTPQWSEAILTFEGDSDFQKFEQYRAHVSSNG
jgi:predicted transcriptional regulator